jgi:hypothetical protein
LSRMLSMEKMSFQAFLRYILATDLAAFLLGALIVLLASRIRDLLSPLAAVAVIAALALAFGGDLMIWVSRGIRSIEIDGETLTLFRGRELTPQIITRQEIVTLATKRRFMRRTVTMRLSGLKVVRITEEAFSPEVFSRFLSVLAGWDQRN